MHEITGRTRIFGILADPIHHVKTPQALNALMEKRGFDGVLAPCQVGAADLAAFVGGAPPDGHLDGFIVTVPPGAGPADPAGRNRQGRHLPRIRRGERDHRASGDGRRRLDRLWLRFR
jgi:hypothetical protein